MLMVCMIARGQENNDFHDIKKSIRQYIPSGLEKHFGIKKLIDIDSLKVGKIIFIYTVNTIDTTLSHSNIMLIPISLNDSVLFFAKAKQVEESIEIIGVGGNVFARKFNRKQALCRRFQNLAFLSIPELNQYFVFEQNNYKKIEVLKIDFHPIEDLCSGCFLDSERTILIGDIISMIENKIKGINSDEEYTN